MLATLKGGPWGFELSRAVDGISDSMLSDRLAEVVEARLVTRTVREGPPLSVTYALMGAGRALLPALEHITRWAQKHLPAEVQVVSGEAPPRCARRVLGPARNQPL